MSDITISKDYFEQLLAVVEAAKEIDEILQDQRFIVEMRNNLSKLLAVVQAAKALEHTLNQVSGEVNWKSRANTLIRKDWESLTDTLDALGKDEE